MLRLLTPSDNMLARITSEGEGEMATPILLLASISEISSFLLHFICIISSPSNFPIVVSSLILSVSSPRTLELMILCLVISLITSVGGGSRIWFGIIVS